MTRPLVVVEVESGGHRMIYFAAVAAFLAGRGVPVTLASSRAALGSDDLRMRMPTGPEPAGAWDGLEVGEIGSVRELVGAVARVQAARPDADVLVTEGDKFLPELVRRGGGVDPRRLRVLVMRAPRVSPGLLPRAPGAWARDVVKLAAMHLAVRRGVDVRVLEPATVPRAHYSSGRWPSAPDPVELHPARDDDPAAAPPELAVLDPDRHRLGVLGHVGPRKNLDRVLDAAASAGARELAVVVAGRVEAGEWERCAGAVARFRSAGGQLVVADRLLSDAGLDACVAAVDTVVLAHSSEGPSGILGRAAALGTPVLAAGARSLRDDVARLDAGTWTTLDALGAGLRGRLAAARGVRPDPHPPAARLAGADEFARALLT